jgi:hypothetical protein
VHNVPPERIGEIVAEVESHVAGTGEDPREAFGPARDYAAGFSHPRSWGSVAAQAAPAVLSALCGFLIAVGIVGLVDGESRPVFGLPAGVTLAAGVTLWIPVLVMELRRNRPVPDPRTGRPITPGPAAAAVGGTAFLAVLALACWGLAVPTS